MNLGHMSLIENPVMQSGQYYYLLNDTMCKAYNTTTKMWVVFDASIKTSKKLTLYGVLLADPVIQPEFFDIVLCFQLLVIVITADVTKI